MRGRRGHDRPALGVRQGQRGDGEAAPAFQGKRQPEQLLLRDAPHGGCVQQRPQGYSPSRAELRRFEQAREQLPRLPGSVRAADARNRHHAAADRRRRGHPQVQQLRRGHGQVHGFPHSQHDVATRWGNPGPVVTLPAGHRVSRQRAPHRRLPAAGHAVKPGLRGPSKGGQTDPLPPETPLPPVRQDVPAEADGQLLYPETHPKSAHPAGDPELRGHGRGRQGYRRRLVADHPKYFYTLEVVGRVP